MRGKADPRRILVVDDNPDMRLMLALLLKPAGYDVVVARNGREALDVQRRRPVDVVITDLFMPEADGLETVERFRADYPELPLIVVSGGPRGGAKTDYLSVARELGARVTLRKPFSAEELFAALREV